MNNIIIFTIAIAFFIPKSYLWRTTKSFFTDSLWNTSKTYLLHQELTIEETYKQAKKDLRKFLGEKKYSDLSTGIEGHLSSEQVNAIRIEYVHENNYFRDIHNVQQLKSDPKLHEIAQIYANYLAKYDEFEHSPYAKNGILGENLGISTKLNDFGAFMAKYFYKEFQEFGYNFKGHTSFTIKKECGHATAMIWKSAKAIGVGVASGYSREFQRIAYHIVTVYYPPTNTLGQYKTNVLPPLIEIKIDNV